MIFASLTLLAVNGFFVAAEFAIVAAKPHRLESAEAEGNTSAGAALAGTRQLSIVLAGAQLGITLCTLGLGALAEPSVAHLVEPLLTAVGLPLGAAGAIAVAFAVILVGFLHVVVGEMAPKSWAISHPEDSAMLLAKPFVWFTNLVRPILTLLNVLANACLRGFKVSPQDELVNAHGPQELRILIESSREHGTLDAPQHQLLSAMLAIQNTTVDQVMTPVDQIVCISAEAEARQVERVSRAAGRSRLVVRDPTNQRMIGIVHVRDAARATTNGQQVTAAELMDFPLILPATTPVATAVRLMRQRRSQLALVADHHTRPLGVVALEDLLEELIGEFDDETDPVPAAARASQLTTKGCVR